MTGQVISRYRILDKLGEGGMGLVYKAEDTKLRRMVALKFLPAHFREDVGYRTRFVREAQSAAALNHPNICTIHEIEEEHGFIAMEYVEGRSLKDRIAERPLRLDEALDIAIQVARGLEAAHEKGIVHRDIKPGNILLTSDGRVKITDFGLAQIEDATRLTQSNLAIGTPAYMSPEQHAGRPSDRRSDLYSLGVVLYEILSGCLPALAQPEPLTSLRGGLPRDIDRIVAKTLATDPRERYQNAADLAVDLRRLRADGQPQPIGRRRIIGVAGLTAVAAGTAGVWYWRRSPPNLLLSNGGRRSKIPEANEYFEKALFLLRPQFELPRARQLLERAIALDPHFGEARAMYAFTHFLMIESGASNDAAWLYRAEQEARQVLRDQSSSVSAHVALAASYLAQGRKELAATEARLATDLNPGRHIFLARLYQFDGDRDRAITILRGLLNREPLFFPARMTLSDLLRQKGDYEEALRELDKILEQNPQLLYGLLYSALVCMNQGQLEKSRQSLERLRPEDRSKYNVRLLWALQFALEGNRLEALREMDAEVLKYAEFLTWTSWPVEVYSVLGEQERALEWLDRAVRMGDHRAEWFQRNPLLANIRNHPRFGQIIDVIRRRRTSAP